MAREGINFHYCILVMIGGLVGSLYPVIFRYFFSTSSQSYLLFSPKPSAFSSHCLFSSKPRPGPTIITPVPHPQLLDLWQMLLPRDGIGIGRRKLKIAS